MKKQELPEHLLKHLRRPPLRIYTLQSVAREIKVSYSQLRKVLIRYRQGEIDSYRGFKFLSLGSPERASWIAYHEDIDIFLIDDWKTFKLVSIDDPRYFLFTSKAAADAAGVSYEYLRKIFSRYRKKGDSQIVFKKFKFLPLGDSPRDSWVLYGHNDKVHLVDTSDKTFSAKVEWDDEEGCYVSSSPIVPFREGASLGKSPDDALEGLAEIIRHYFRNIKSVDLTGAINFDPVDVPDHW